MGSLAASAKEAGRQNRFGAGVTLGTVRTCLAISTVGRRRVASLVSLGLLASLMESAGALLLLLVFRSVSDSQSPLSLPLVGNLNDRFPGVSHNTVLVYFCGLVAVFFVARSFVLLLQVHVQYRTAYNQAAEISRCLMQGYLERDYALFLGKNSADLTRTTWDAANMVATSGFIPMLAASSEIFIVVGLVVVLAVKAPVLTAISVFVTGSVLWLTLRVIQPRLGALGHSYEKTTTAVYLLMQQCLTGARDVRLAQSEDYFVDEFRRERMRTAKGFYSYATLSSVPRVLLETIFAVFILLFVAVAAVGNRLDPDTVALLGLFAYAVLRIMPSINRVSAAANNLRFGGAAIETVKRDLDSAEEAAARRPSCRRDAIRLTDRIAVDNVSYRYPNHDRDVLTAVSLEIPRGQSVGLVGPTGAGKSTLVDLILGLLTPTHGRVLVDGTDIAECPAAWQRSLGVVSQSVFLLDDTLRRNIAFGIPDESIDEARVAEAVQMAQLDDFVASLPDGVHTAVGEQGVRVSGGQRQRVAIARAFYRRPEVVVFDEGTSALDRLTETEVMAALDRLRGGRTLIMVAHRLTTVRRCDTIVLLEGGRITEAGTFDELVERNDNFRRMAL